MEKIIRVLDNCILEMKEAIPDLASGPSDLYVIAIDNAQDLKTRLLQEAKDISDRYYHHIP